MKWIEPLDRVSLNNATTGAKARVSYRAFYYDAANRPTAAVDVGTNGGSAYTRPSSVPSRSDTVLVTSMENDSAGRRWKTFDPRNIETRTSYDMLGRTTQTIEAYVDGTPSSGDDRTTQQTYNGSGQVLTLKALLPSSAFQTTEYVYGVTTTGGSGVNSNEMLATIKYPDKSTGS